MLKINDSVMHKTSGVCRVRDIRMEDFGAGRKEYYVLEPAYDKGMTIYIPVDSEKAQLRHLMTASEIRSLIDGIRSDRIVWIEDERKRKQQYREILKKDDPAELVALINLLYQKKKEKEKEGKKFYAEDEATMTEAENLLHGEIAFVMDIEPDEVVSYIAGVIAETKK